MDEGARLDRLTEREKECLRLWLHHKTAKEIALDLGISHHAVEKRLKMARTKLDVGSSLEAARMLAEAEGYGLAVAQPPDLQSEARAREVWFTKPLTLGVVTMSILAAILLTYAAQTGSGPDPERPSQAESDAPARPQFMSAIGTPEQVEEYVQANFARFDRDGSGYIEPSEGPERIDLRCCGSDGSVLTGEEAWDRFLSDNGDDGDNRVSYAEYHAARYENLLRNGIPVPSENFTRVGERRSPYVEPQPGAGDAVITSEDLQYVDASPERVRAYVRQMFDNWDADSSGFVEVAEAPARLITQQARLQDDGTATYDPNDPNQPGEELEGDAARQQYIDNVDLDGDGRVSFEEYAAPVMPQFLRRGIPLIPADWRPADNSRAR